jgi:hypothetical protein
VQRPPGCAPASYLYRAPVEESVTVAIVVEKARTALRYGNPGPKPAEIAAAESGAGLPRSTCTPLMLNADSSISTVHAVAAHASATPEDTGSCTCKSQRRVIMPD